MCQVSIITVNYNDKIGLERTIKSVQEQTSSDYEHIIIDGNSNDGSKDIITEHQNNFSYWISEPDTGIYEAMNKGIDVSNGKYLLFLNSGDALFKPDVLKTVEINLKNNFDIVFGDLWVYRIDKTGFKHSYAQDVSTTVLKRIGLGHPSTFIKTKIFQKYGKYRTDLKIVSDWEFFIKVILREKVSCFKIDEIISVFYEGGISSSPDFSDLHLEERKKVFIENFDIYDQDFEKIYAHYNKINALLSSLHPDIDILITNNKSLRILNKTIGFYAFFLKKKRQWWRKK
ncbi:family 2 glycosyl transferase [Nonlabens sp. YIK11]|uniref:glycosyltransferase family 2 protein n=1 Tax=Nonlabens sp. YIK11 TaxID=1453349 RepID=UPI0006DC6308|nr:glycosyltransferase family 2 protein [Nonlabens sp. YIK11]KQC34146.1 family 2 glycosyl transferase [Nonlabens sp. YIK11]